MVRAYPDNPGPITSGQPQGVAPTGNVKAKVIKEIDAAQDRSGSCGIHPAGLHESPERGVLPQMAVEEGAGPRQEGAGRQTDGDAHEGTLDAGAVLGGEPLYGGIVVVGKRRGLAGQEALEPT